MTDIKDIAIDAYDYPLPEERIAAQSDENADDAEYSRRRIPECQNQIACGADDCTRNRSERISSKNRSVRIQPSGQIVRRGKPPAEAIDHNTQQQNDCFQEKREVSVLLHRIHLPVSGI